jgi:hypothetical protein
MGELRQPVWLKPEEVPRLPEGWRAMPTEEACVQFKPGKLFETKTVSEHGAVPVLNQSETDFLGYHDEEPGVDASPEKPVVTFANHTCAMRLMKRPFSTIQNIFPKVGKPGVTDTVYFYYASLGRIGLSDYKGHHPLFRQAHIPVPPLPVQRRIAGILSAYDELMENSQRRIRLLEAMARALYREWFVHFRFPGHEKHPRVASPLGDIPQGWEVKPLFELTKVNYGKNLPTKKLADDGAHPVYGAAKIIGRYTEYTRERRTIICGCRGSVGEMQITEPQCYVTNNSFTFDPTHPDNFFWLFHTLKERGLRDVVGGAAQPQITLEGISSVELVTPPLPLRTRFQQAVSAMFEQAWTLDNQIQNLRRTRDLLLPRLLSGKVEPKTQAA